MQSPVKRMEALVCTKAGSNHIDINLFLDSTIKKCVLKIGFHLIKKISQLFKSFFGKIPKILQCQIAAFCLWTSLVYAN